MLKQLGLEFMKKYGIILLLIFRVIFLATFLASPRYISNQIIPHGTSRKEKRISRKYFLRVDSLQSLSVDMPYKPTPFILSKTFLSFIPYTFCMFLRNLQQSVDRSLEPIGV